MDGLWSPGRQKRAHEVVLSVDEKTSILALQRTQLPLPLRSGRAVRHTHDYKRHEVVDLYAALEIATGRVTHRVTESHTPAEVRRYPKQERRGRLGRVRSQVITIMAPEDEAAFLGFVFERPTVYLIPDVRNPTPEVPRTRDIREHKSLHCMLWDKAILPQLRIEHIPSCSDYYLRSDVSVRATAGFFLEAGQDSSPEPGGPGGRDAQSEWKIAGQEVDDVLLDDASRENGHDGGEILDGVDAAERARAQEREDDGGALSAAL